MQILDSQLVTALDQDHEMIGTPVVIAEWNFNRLVKTTVTNISDPNNTLWAYTQTHFPPSSITEGFRPDKGMVYGFMGKALPINDQQLGQGGTRYYYCSKDAAYKYWISPTPSQDPYDMLHIDLAPDEFTIDNSDLLVEYDAWIKVNKVKVTFNHDIRPKVWRIAVFDQIVNNWVTIATSPTINETTGRAEVWWNGTSWVQTQQLDVTKYRAINKIRVEIDSLTTPSDRLEIIEIAGMREVDLSDRVQSYSIDMSMDDVDYVHPVGQMSSSDGKISINNRDLELDLADPTKDFYGLIDGWCEYRTYVKFDMTKYATSDKIVRTGTMYSNGWVATSPYEYEIQLFDIVKIIQGIKTTPLLFENRSIARILSTLLDMAGIDKYEFGFEDFDPTEKIRYFWTDGSESVYEALNRICKSHQCVIFTDEFGKIQLLTRNQIVNEDDVEDFTLRATPSGLTLPNISDLKKKYDISINDVEIKWKRKEANIDATDVTGRILTSKVWDTSDPIVIRAAPLMRNLSETDVPNVHVVKDVPADVFIPEDKVETWPYSGMLNIDGEIFKYEGKGYAVIDYSTGAWAEHIIKSEEERRKFNKQTYDSYTPNGSSGGFSGQPIRPIYGGGSDGDIIQNKFTGRLRITERGMNGSKWAAHSKETKFGWAAYNIWAHDADNSNYPGKYIEPGKAGLTLTALRDWKNKPGWGKEQRAWTQLGSKLINDNIYKPQWFKLSSLITELDSTEYREFGMRFKFTEGVPDVGLVLCISSQDGYAEDPEETDVTACHRMYILNIHSTALIEAAGRQCNEVVVQVKDGDDLEALDPLTTDEKEAGKIQLDLDKWYDVDVVVKDNKLANGQNKMNIEVFINGQFIETFTTRDVIRPTNFFGVFSRYAGKAEFEYVYASSSTGFNRDRYTNENADGSSIITLPAGTNVTKSITLPDNWWVGRVAMSLASLGSVQVHSAKAMNYYGTVINDLGPTTIPADSKRLWLLKDAQKNDNNAIVQFKINYTSTQDISVLLETTLYGSIPIYGYIDTYQVYPDDTSYWNYLKGGYSSTKMQHMLIANNSEFNKGFTNVDVEVNEARRIFFDDFGSIVREIRPFDVEFSVSPAKGTSVYVSNPEVVVTDHKESPIRGIFNLVNASHRDQIVNGNEQLDESNSIDHSLLIYGYVLVEKEEKTKRVKNEESIRKHGPYPTELDAEWINSDDEAEALAKWIVDNWGGIMDTIEVTTFLTVAAQIGDKVKVVYPDAQVDPNWMFVVSNISKDYDNSGLSTSLTLRRVG